jgi:putative DNA methylase
MPNHVHALVQPLKSASLSRVLHQWKSYSARKLQGTESVPGAGAVWQDERYDRIVRNEYELRSFHDYILGNPAAARLKLGSYVVGEGQAQWLAR